MSENFRELTPQESDILRVLLSKEFPGRAEIDAQIASSRVRKIDENGSLEFDVKTALKVPIKKRIPIEGEAKDADGMTIHILLHVVDGVTKELELYREDLSPIVHLPTPSEMKVFTFE